MRRAQRSTVIAAIVLAAVAAGCGASKAQIQRARTSAYDADFAIVYSEALAAVRDLYPDLEEDPSRGVISTVWHQVHFTSNQDSREDDDAPTADAPRNTGLVGNQPRAVKRTFVRFDVTVAGARPFRVRVTGKASQWDVGDAKPTDLKGAAKPAWLAGRIDGLTVAIYKRLKPYAIHVEEEVVVEEEGPTVDKAMFGDIPPEAADVAAAIVLAIDTRKPATIRDHLAADVVWSLGAPGDADTALAMWQADPATLEALKKTLSAGCLADGDVVTCPRAAVEQPGYVDWRVTLELRDGAWKVTSFVTGD
jgi:hypothetical protein